MKTYSAKPSEVTRKWVVIDASTSTMGRVASTAAKRLIGKYDPKYTPHVDGGDYVVIINADKTNFDPRKLTQKKYYRHSGHPGSLKTTTLKAAQEKDASKVLENAVKGMLPKNKLQSGRAARLHVYSGDEHPHQGQKPEKVEVK